MNPPRSVPEFLTQLQTTLQLESRLKDRIMTEVEDHLIETADRLRADGLPDEEAARMAILRFGTPKEVGLHFAGENIMETPLRSPIRKMPNGVRLLVFFVLLCAVLQLLAALSMSWRENQLANWLAVGQSVLSWTVGFGLWKYRNWSKVVTLVWIGFSMPWGLLLTFTALSLAGVSFFTFPSPNLMAALWFLTITIAAEVILCLFFPHARDLFC